MPRRKIVVYAAAACGLVVGALAVVKWRWDATCFRGYDSRLSLDATETLARQDRVLTQYRLRFRSTLAESVPALLDIPTRPTAPVPCLVFLHGLGQRKEFLNDIALPFVQAGYAIVTFDQLGCGERQGEEPKGLDVLKQLRRRCSQTVTDTRRLVDYLETRTDVDRKRLVLIGGSLGAMIGADVVALEPRFRAAWLIYGGGNFPQMLRENKLMGTSGVYGWVVGRAGGFLLKPIDPRYHVGRIAPRPVLMQNGTRDTIIPPECARQLHDRAREPKTVKWYESDHIGDDPQVVRQVTADGMAWLESVL